MPDPVQVLVTIHPPENAHEDWERADWTSRVHMALYHEWSGTTLSPQRYDVEAVHGQPHGEAKAHREAAERALEDSDMMSRHDDGWWQHRATQAVAHALLALGERP